MPDTWTVRIVIISLAVLAMEALGLAAWLIYTGRDAGAVASVIGVTTVCVGAIAALLASTNSKPQP